MRSETEVAVAVLAGGVADQVALLAELLQIGFDETLDFARNSCWRLYFSISSIESMELPRSCICWFGYASRSVTVLNRAK